MLSKNKKKSILSDILSVLKKNKRLRIAVYAVCAAAVLFLCLGKKDNNVSGQVTVVSSTEQDAEKRLAEVLSEIRGAGRVKVMITYDTTEEIVPAMSSTHQESSSQNDGSQTNNESEQNQLATINKGGEQSPVVLTQIQPKVRGVIIIAEGASDISVKLSLEYAAATVLGVDSDAIEVFEMKSE